MAEKKEKQVSSLPRPLRLFYGVGEFGQQLSVLTLNLYLLYFYTTWNFRESGRYADAGGPDLGCDQRSYDGNHH